MQGVDIDGREVRFEGEEWDHVLAYEHLIFAFGSRANMDLVPGMAEHAMPIKLLGDALALRSRVIEQMEKAEQEEDSATRRWLSHFVIIGAGFSGVEIGGAIQDFNHSSHKHYPRLGLVNGVAEIFGDIRLGGFPAWLMWRAFYLSLMPTMAKKTRILFEWTWSMLFSPDIINLRFTTTENADKSRDERHRG